MLQNMLCYWPVVLCLWCPVMPLLQWVKHAGPTASASTDFNLVHNAKLSDYTRHITLHSAVLSVILWSPVYVIGLRNVTSGSVSPRDVSVNFSTMLLWNSLWHTRPQPKQTARIKWMGKHAFSPQSLQPKGPIHKITDTSIFICF